MERGRGRKGLKLIDNDVKKEDVKELRKGLGRGGVGDYSGARDVPVSRIPCDVECLSVHVLCVSLRLSTVHSHYSFTLHLKARARLYKWLCVYCTVVFAVLLRLCVACCAQ